MLSYLLVEVGQQQQVEERLGKKCPLHAYSEPHQSNRDQTYCSNSVVDYNQWDRAIAFEAHEIYVKLRGWGGGKE